MFQENYEKSILTTLDPISSRKRPWQIFPKLEKSVNLPGAFPTGNEVQSGQNRLKTMFLKNSDNFQFF